MEQLINILEHISLIIKEKGVKKYYNNTIESYSFESDKQANEALKEFDNIIHVNNGIISVNTYNAGISCPCNLININEVIEVIKLKRKKLTLLTETETILSNFVKVASFDKTMINEIKKFNNFVGVEKYCFNDRLFNIFIYPNKIIASNSFILKNLEINTGSKELIILDKQAQKFISKIKHDRNTDLLNIYHSENNIKLEYKETSCILERLNYEFPSIDGFFNYNDSFEVNRKQLIDELDKLKKTSNCINRIDFHVNGVIEMEAKDIDWNLSSKSNLSYLNSTYEGNFAANAELLKLCLKQNKNKIAKIGINGEKLIIDDNTICMQISM